MIKPADMFDRDREWSQVASFVADELTRGDAGGGVGSSTAGEELPPRSCMSAGRRNSTSPRRKPRKPSHSALIGAALTRHLDPVAPVVPGDWTAVIDIPPRLGREGPVPVVIDEFPYLARGQPCVAFDVFRRPMPRAEPASRVPDPATACGSRRPSWAVCFPAAPRCGARVAGPDRPHSRSPPRGAILGSADPRLLSPFTRSSAGHLPTAPR